MLQGHKCTKPTRAYECGRLIVRVGKYPYVQVRLVQVNSAGTRDSLLYAQLGIVRGTSMCSPSLTGTLEGGMGSQICLFCVIVTNRPGYPPQFPYRTGAP
jgi:hypothetical protein